MLWSFSHGVIRELNWLKPILWPNWTWKEQCLKMQSACYVRCAVLIVWRRDALAKKKPVTIAAHICMAASSLLHKLCVEDSNIEKLHRRSDMINFTTLSVLCIYTWVFVFILGSVRINKLRRAIHKKKTCNVIQYTRSLFLGLVKNCIDLIKKKII